MCGRASLTESQASCLGRSASGFCSLRLAVSLYWDVRRSSRTARRSRTGFGLLLSPAFHARDETRPCGSPPATDCRLTP